MRGRSRWNTRGRFSRGLLRDRLALRTGCPIFVARDVIIASGSKDEAADDDEAVAEGTLDLSDVDREEWNEILENLDPTDFKYKM